MSDNQFEQEEIQALQQQLASAEAELQRLVTEDNKQFATALAGGGGRVLLDTKLLPRTGALAPVIYNQRQRVADLHIQWLDAQMPALRERYQAAQGARELAQARFVSAQQDLQAALAAEDKARNALQINGTARFEKLGQKVELEHQWDMFMAGQNGTTPARGVVAADGSVLRPQPALWSKTS
jgi:hypothetical protein